MQVRFLVCLSNKKCEWDGELCIHMHIDGNARTIDGQSKFESKVGQQAGYELTNRGQAKLRTNISNDETSAKRK
jgi:hypothetical protein